MEISIRKIINYLLLTTLKIYLIKIFDLHCLEEIFLLIHLFKHVSIFNI